MKRYALFGYKTFLLELILTHIRYLQYFLVNFCNMFYSLVYRPLLSKACYFVKLVVVMIPRLLFITLCLYASDYTFSLQLLHYFPWLHSHPHPVVMFTYILQPHSSFPRLCGPRVCLPPHPNIVDMPCVFVDRVPLLEDGLNLYPHALPARLNPQGYGRNMSLFCVMKRWVNNM